MKGQLIACINAFNSIKFSLYEFDDTVEKLIMKNRRKGLLIFVLKS